MRHFVNLTHWKKWQEGVPVPYKLPAAAARAYITEYSGVETAIGISEMIAKDLRAFGYGVDINALNRFVAPVFRSIRQDSGWGGNKAVKTAVKRQRTSGVRDRPLPAMGQEELRVAHGTFRKEKGAEGKGREKYRDSIEFSRKQ